MNREITYNEVIKLFLEQVLPKIKREEECPKINFVFDDDALDFFDMILKSRSQSSIMDDQEMDEQRKTLLNSYVKREQNQDADVPTITIHDTEKFFTLLKEIINATVQLNDKYSYYVGGKDYFQFILTRIWYRMGIEDFNHVEEFLERQLQFVKNDSFDQYRYPQKFTTFFEYNVIITSEIGLTWDETPRSVTFTIVDKEGNRQDLPTIRYGLLDDNTCYIYAVQSKKNKKKSIPGLGKYLRYWNHGIENPNVPLEHLTALIFFIQLLKKHEVTQVKVPTLQVLSYRYHEIISQSTKEKFEKTYDDHFFENISNLLESARADRLKKYEEAVKLYDTYVGKEDTISKIKTQNLIHLIYRLAYHIPDYLIENDIDNQEGTLNIRLIDKQKQKIKNNVS